MKLLILVLVISAYGESFKVHLIHNITLLKSHNEQDPTLNDKFQKIATRMGFQVNIMPFYENAVKYTINVARHHPNVIKLKVSIEDIIENIIEFRKGFDSSNLMCSTDCMEYSTLKYTHLISSSIPYDYGSLFQVIDHEPFKYYSEILICLPRNTPNFNIYKTYLETNNHLWDVEIRNDCEANLMPNEHTLAMITYEAPNTDLLLPTIFYHTPYMSPEVMDKFANSLSLSTEWAPLKYAFVEFLKKMNWQRVALVSDDAAYSVDFADELASLFTVEGFIFTDQRCSKTCNFIKSLNLLKNADAKVIILNVDKENARQLVSAIARLNLTGVLWIVRDWPFEQVSLGMTEVYSITLSPGYNITEDYYPYLSSINKGLQIIDRIYKSVLGDREKFIKELSKAVRPKNYKTYAYVMLFRDNSDPNVVASMVIEEHHVKITRFSNVYDGAVPSDLRETCIVRSYDYFQPCNHLKLLLLVLVWIVFALAVLIIIVCFNKYRQKRYNRLS